MNAEQTLLWMEQMEQDSFRVKRSYIDATEDLISGILLGQIVFWYLPNKSGASKLRVVKEGKKWLAKGREDWFDEIRITPKQFDRAIKILKEKGFVETKLYKFNNAPTIHISLDFEKVMSSILPKGKNGISPKVKMDFTQRDKSLTEITSETTNNKDSSSSENPLKRVFASYQENIYHNISGIDQQKLIDDIDTFGADMVLYAIEEAVTNNKRSYKYMEAIMRSWRQEGVQTLEQAKARSKQFERQKGERQYGANRRRTGGNHEEAASARPKPRDLLAEREEQLKASGEWKGFDDSELNF